MTRLANEGGLKRAISVWGFAAVTLNGVIGGGLFVLPAVAASKTGWWSPWLFLACGLMFLSIVWSFARLARQFAHTGGPSVYVSSAFGAFLGFETGWLLYLGRITAMAANTNLLVTYLAWFWPSLSLPLLHALLVAIVLMTITAINARGVQHGLITVTVLTIMKLSPLFILFVASLPHFSLALFRVDALPPPVTVGETVLLLFYAFVGFESGTINAGEGRSPQRDIPRALFRTVLFTALLYFLVQWLTMSVLGDRQASQQPLADVAQIVIGSVGATLMVFAAIASILGNVSSAILSAPRMSYALARDHCLPAWFAVVHPRFATPFYSILFAGVISTLLAVSNTFIYLAIMSTLVRLIGYALCIAALSRVEKTPLHRLPIALLAIGVCLVLMWFVSWQAWLMCAAFIVIGAGLYFWARRHSDRHGC